MFKKIYILIVISFLTGGELFAQMRPKTNVVPPPPIDTTKRIHTKPILKTRPQEEAAVPYYQVSNFITLNFGFFYFKQTRTTSLPIYFNPELTVIRNLSAGVQIMHYQYKEYVKYNDPSNANYGYSEYLEYKKNFNHLLAALKVSYHLNDIVKDNLKIIVNPKKMDLYVSGLVGYNFVTPGAPPKASEMKLGFAVGGRYIYSKRLAFFMEYGLNSYGYGSMGASWMLGERF